MLLILTLHLLFFCRSFISSNTENFSIFAFVKCLRLSQTLYSYFLFCCYLFFEMFICQLFIIYVLFEQHFEFSIFSHHSNIFLFCKEKRLEHQKGFEIGFVKKFKMMIIKYIYAMCPTTAISQKKGFQNKRNSSSFNS